MLGPKLLYTKKRGIKGYLPTNKPKVYSAGCPIRCVPCWILVYLGFRLITLLSPSGRLVGMLLASTEMPAFALQDGEPAMVTSPVDSVSMGPVRSCCLRAAPG